MELIDLVIELERYCDRNDFNKYDSVEDLINHMNKQVTEEEF